MNRPVKIAESLYWVGVQNPDLRRFDVVMHTPYGTTYNAYLVVGEQKTALVECVKDGFFEEYLARVQSICDVKSIDYIVLNHTEPDHSGSLKDVLAAAPQAKVVCSQAAAGFLKEMLNAPFDPLVAKDGMELPLGGKTLKFISAPFLHWPDSMFTYVPEDRTLISGDVFGCHFADARVLESCMDDTFLVAQKYYFDVIMGPFTAYVRDALEKIRGLEIGRIAPSHGPVLDRDPMRAIESYGGWAAPRAGNTVPKALIGYVSCYGYTRRIGDALKAELEGRGVAVEMLDVGLVPMDELLSRSLEADALLIGSPTLNRDVLPPVWSWLTSLSPLMCKSKPMAVFGSFGWSGEAIRFMEERVKQLGAKLVGTVSTRFVPADDVIEEAKALAAALAETLKAGGIR